MDKMCSKKLFSDWHHHPCPRKATVLRGSLPFCKIHDPEYIKTKDEAKTAQFNKEWEAEKAMMKLRRTASEACAEINPQSPLAVATGIKDVVEALERFLESSACSNGCDPEDMTCDTSFARKALASIKKEAC